MEQSALDSISISNIRQGWKCSSFMSKDRKFTAKNVLKNWTQKSLFKLVNKSSKVNQKWQDFGAMTIDHTNKAWMKKRFSTFPTLSVCQSVSLSREYWKGKYHCTVDLLFDWFGISCMLTDNCCFYLENRLIQTSQTGGQQYSDTSPFSISGSVSLSVSTKMTRCEYSPWSQLQNTFSV